MSSSLRFWQAMTWVGPIVAAVLPPLVVSLFGGFDDLVWVGQPVNIVQSFGILGAMCFPIAAFAFVRMKIEIELSRLSQSWPSVSGQLLDKQVKERTYVLVSKRYIFAVRYGYEVAGQRYFGDRLAFAPRLLPGGVLFAQLDQKYKTGQPVTVHYDPADPTSAVLETGDGLARQRLFQVWWTLGMTLVAILVVGIVNA